MPKLMCHIKGTYSTAPNTETPLPNGVFSFESQAIKTKWIKALNIILMQRSITSHFILQTLDPITTADVNDIERFSAELHKRIAKHIGLEARVNLTSGIDELPHLQKIKVVLIGSEMESHAITFTPAQWRKFYTFCTQLLSQQKQLAELELNKDPFKKLGLPTHSKRRQHTKDNATRTRVDTQEATNDDDLPFNNKHRRQRQRPTRTQTENEQQLETLTEDSRNRRQRNGQPSSPPVNRRLNFEELEGASPNIKIKKRKPARFKDDLNRVEEVDTLEPNLSSTHSESHASSPETLTSTNSSAPTKSTDGTLKEKPSKKIALDALTAAGFVGGFLSAGAGAWLLFNASSAAAASGASAALGTLMLANPTIPALIGLACVLAIAATSVIIARQPRVKACSKRLFQSCNPQKLGDRASFDNSQ